MLEQLLMVEQSHKQALYKLEDEKKNHGEFMKKSDEFTNLLEQERERSVCALNDDHNRKCICVGFLGESTVTRAACPIEVQHAEEQYKGSDIVK